MAEAEQKQEHFSLEMVEKIVTAAVAAARAPNPKEAREIEQDVQRERRRTLLSVELAKVEEEKTQRRKHGCSHSRVENGSKNAGMPAPKGTGEWTTGGRLVGQG